MTRRGWILSFLLAAALPAAPAQAKLSESRLWMERFYWDGLLTARDKASRQSADPALIKVVHTLAVQAAQQAANLEQIHAYVKGQSGNLRYAFAQTDPGPSLAVIQNNFATLAKGADQIRNNLYYLTTRTRMCTSQALADPKLTKEALLLIAQIQNAQLKLNALYTVTADVNRIVHAETWAVDDYFRFHADHLLNMVVSVQRSVFSVYNASYELYLLSK